MKCFITSCTRKTTNWYFKRCGLKRYGKMKCFITSCTRKASNVAFQTLPFEKVRENEMFYNVMYLKSK